MVSKGRHPGLKHTPKTPPMDAGMTTTSATYSDDNQRATAWLGWGPPEVSSPTSQSPARWNQAVHSGAQQDNKNQQAKIEQDIQTGCKEKPFPCEDSGAVAGVAQRGCAVSLEVF